MNLVQDATCNGGSGKSRLGENRKPGPQKSMRALSTGVRRTPERDSVLLQHHRQRLQPGRMHQFAKLAPDEPREGQHELDVRAGFL